MPNHGSATQKASRFKVWRALQSGKLVRPDHCQRCNEVNKPTLDGRSYLQAHHKDANKPLEVEWVCPRCHARLDPKKHGVTHPRARLTESDVKKIIGLFGHYTKIQIAEMFGVSEGAIKSIRTGESWADVTGFKRRIRTPVRRKR